MNCALYGLDLFSMNCALYGLELIQYELCTIITTDANLSLTSTADGGLVRNFEFKNELFCRFLNTLFICHDWLNKSLNYSDVIYSRAHHSITGCAKSALESELLSVVISAQSIVKK